MSRVYLWDIPFDPIRGEEVAGRVQSLLDDGKQHVVTTPNPEILLESLRNPGLKAFLQRSDLSLADGVGVLWAKTYEFKVQSSKFKVEARKRKAILHPLWTQGTSLAFCTLHFFITASFILFAPRKIRAVLPGRVTGVDSMLDICEVAARGGKGVFLLGGRERVGRRTAEVLQGKFPPLRIAGMYGGRPFSADDDVIADMINQSGAAVLFVAFGCPKQERWIEENLEKLPNVRLAMGVGGSFDFISGAIKRAPAWMKTLGVEWLYRLFQEPWKRLPRIWRAVVVFPARVWGKV